jgi:polar amino acid transport system substrate-binding protein
MNKAIGWSGLARRRMMGALVAGTAMVLGAGAMAAPDEAARKLLPDDVKQKGVLVAAMPLDFEPFNYLDAQNNQVGLDVELFQAIAETLGLKGEIQRLGFASIVPAVKGGRVDVGMSAMGILPARLPLVSFVRYGHFSNGLIVKKGNPANVRNDQGCGARIAAEKGTQPLFLWQKIAEKCAAEGKPKPEITIFDGKGPQVLAVESGRADAAAVGYSTAIVAAKHSDGKLQAAPGGPVPGGTVECGISFAKEREKLGDAMKAALDVLVANGTYDKIFAKWDLSEERAPPAVVK